MNDLNYVIYSHSDYSDVLKIQTDYTFGIDNKILLIDEQFNDNEIISKYKKVLRYDDKLPYSNRLLSLNELDFKYILLIHDIDILLSYDNNFISSCVKKMDEMNIDRIDLQYYPPHWNPNTNRIDLNFGDKTVKLVKQEDINGFIYNVNPSIWKLKTLINLMENFQNRTYRNIEMLDVQIFLSKFNVYKLYNNHFLQVGYFKCLDEFVFLHISHTGMFLPKTNNDLPSEIQITYKSIIEKYLQNSNKNFRTTMHG